MKRILKFFLGAIIASASIGAAQAQTQTLGSSIKTGPGASINIASAMMVSTKPGNQYVMDANGRQIPTTLTSASQIMSSIAWTEYAELGQGSGLWANLAVTSRTYCEQRGTIIEWSNRVVQLVPDGCAFAYRVESFSRR